jgi:CheY-like chemotaxis protein
MNILVVDDDPTLRFILQGALTKLGHQVTTANDGLEALELFDKGHVPLLISDMLMPGMDGLELCRRIRRANRSQYTFIILLTMVEGKAGYLEGMRRTRRRLAYVSHCRVRRLTRFASQSR